MAVIIGSPGIGGEDKEVDNGERNWFQPINGGYFSNLRFEKSLIQIVRSQEKML
jgi:hypothetical protein